MIYPVLSRYPVKNVVQAGRLFYIPLKLEVCRPAGMERGKILSV